MKQDPKVLYETDNFRAVQVTADEIDVEEKRKDAMGHPNWIHQFYIAHRDRALFELLTKGHAAYTDLKRELDAAQEHIHAGDECITSLHDDLAHVADIVREWSDVGDSYEAMRAIQKAVRAYAPARKGES